MAPICVTSSVKVGKFFNLDRRANLLAKDDTYWMKHCLKLAQTAADMGEVPVGAVIVKDSKIVAEAHNLRETLLDPTRHAELIAIQKASQKLKNWRLIDCDLYITLEPCVMCAGAIVNSRVRRVIFGASDPKAGGAHSLYHILEDPRLNHQPEVVSGVLGPECGDILSRFFAGLRLQK